jgi:hypothetical protein
VLIDVHPEPSPEERAAILIALRRLIAEQEGAGHPWWVAGLRGNVEDEDEDG